MELIAIGWIASGIIGYGATLAHCKADYPESEHRGFALFIGILGPLGLTAALAVQAITGIVPFKHGLKFW